MAFGMSPTGKTFRELIRWTLPVLLLIFISLIFGYSYGAGQISINSYGIQAQDTKVFSYSLGVKERIGFSVESVPPYDDLYVLDSVNYNILMSQNATNPTAIYGMKNIWNPSYTLTASKSDTYYFVVNNPNSGVVLTTVYVTPYQLQYSGIFPTLEIPGYFVYLVGGLVFLLFILGIRFQVKNSRANNPQTALPKQPMVLKKTCAYCGNEWIENRSTVDLGDSLQKLGQDLARPLFPWTPIREKQPPLRCPKCGSTVIKSELSYPPDKPIKDGATG